MDLSVEHLSWYAVELKVDFRVYLEAQQEGATSKLLQGNEADINLCAVLGNLNPF